MTLVTFLDQTTTILVSTALRFILAIIVFFALIFLFLATIFIHIPLKFTVYLCALIFRPDLEHFVTRASAGFAIDDLYTKPQSNVCAFFVFDGHVDIDSFRKKFKMRVLLKKYSDESGKLMYPELRMYWTTFLNYNFWKKAQFHLENHIRAYDYENELKLPKVEAGFCTDRDLERVMGPLLEKPWEEGRSPWEMLLIHNYKCGSLNSYENKLNKNNVLGKASTVLLFRWHHALLDGYGMSKLIVRDLMLGEPQLHVPPKWTTFENFIFYSTLLFKMPWDFAGACITFVDKTNCWRGYGEEQKLLSKTAVGLSRPVDMRRIKKIKNKYGVSYNAVLCSVAAKACQRLMEAAGQRVPKEITLGCTFPLENHPDGTGNFIKCPMDTKHTINDRLRIISERISPSKFYTAPLTCRLMISEYCYFAPICMIKLIRRNNCTGAFSVLPVAQKSVEFQGLGVSCVDFITGVMHGFGSAALLLGLYSTNGKQRFNILLDKSINLSGNLVRRFGDFVEEEIKALEDTCGD